MHKIRVVMAAVLFGLVSSTCAFAGGTEQDTPNGNRPAAESGGSGR